MIIWWNLWFYELVVRVKAVLRRYQPVKPRKLIPSEMQQIWRSGHQSFELPVIYKQAVDMLPKELELYILFPLQTVVFTREQL